MKSFMIQPKESGHCLPHLKVCSQKVKWVENATCRVGHQMKTFVIEEWKARDCQCHLKILAPSDQVREHSLK